MNARSKIAIAAIACSLWWAAATARGHGDVHPRIDALTTQIAAHPDDPALHAERGRLYEADENWMAAARDEEFAWSHGMQGDRALTFALARSFAHTEDRARALPLLDSLLDVEAANVDYRAVRARILSAMGRDREAADDYANVVAHANPLPPEYVVEYARLLARMNPHEATAALRVLGDGVNRLGPVVVLVDTAVDIERVAGDADGALAWVARLPAVLRATASWRLTEGDLHRSLHRDDRARNAWQEGLRWIDSLPCARRSSAEMTRVREELTRRLVQPVATSAPTRARPRWWMVAVLVLLAIALAVHRGLRAGREPTASRKRDEYGG